MRQGRGPAFHKRIKRQMGKALFDYRMIDPGDRILVAVSGGKDSLSLLHLLKGHLSRAPVDYTLIPAHVDLGTCRSKVDLLSDYFQGEGFLFRMVETRIGYEICGAQNLPESCCFHCSRIRRKLLFETARELGCRKVAFGHHMDDMIETCLMNMFFAGNISTMMPRQELFKGDLVLIRPLAYCREEWIREYARQHGLPVREEACQEGGPGSRRRRIKNLLAQLEKENPGLKTRLFHSLKNVRMEYMPRAFHDGNEPSPCVKGPHVQ
ncbi:MAG: tRNA 2-thiocytidine(32) synthetase TtcA [Nitrospirae bacterium CG_4_9_14_3_um_filter_53_35]|nr:MAG: tRNA 2-thiocytidine(32) synthetase TtcA [Nitrospirae bacterium CG08_land_8_20_14_0_20_52_24]PIW85572.1 MAG: tRNA 2-thiocytidine(32) synthetase TtcA [Nitrospirae bacterium CG_4_8_14_3_um_filter_50_41]PIX86454.1 MAG: tRNA 2-thiocytidine(32) synthetase TtcA [Nitrospirae bacterium CG_4_10_14_3_um_filter_53_41]PJA72847.1 MAG: tRNA 2-thiocytidine(32) synthetase TtcA [Nitrospirae bacterium CG_4_9_14_3_um_filter_53_35]